MKITFSKPYASIQEKFDEINLPDFSVIIGLNGAGKTHFLKGIKERCFYPHGVRLPDERLKVETYYNYDTFRQIDSPLPDSVFKASSPEYLKTLLTDTANTGAGKSILEMVNEAARDIKVPPEVSLWLDLNSQVSSSVGYENERSAFQLNVKGIEEKIPNNIPGKDIGLLKQVMANFGNPPYDVNYVRKHFITKLLEQFGARTSPAHFMSSLQAIIDENIKIAYQETMSAARQSREVPFTFNEYFAKSYKPRVSYLDNFNKVVKEIHSQCHEDIFDFQIQLPSIEDVIKWESSKPTPKIRLIKKGSIEISPEDLSSGEQSLLMLAAFSYLARHRGDFPPLLLLDEIDVFLHPKMSAVLLYILEQEFIKQGCKVILATHSPSLVAQVAHPKSIFQITRTNNQQSIELKNVGKAEAVDILSEGFISLKSGDLKILMDLPDDKPVILSEGHNIHIIKKLLELHNIQSNFHIYDKLVSGSGAGDLKNLFNALHKVHHEENEIVFIWDCDAKNEASSCAKKNNSQHLITLFIERLSPHPFNVLSGIENAFINESLFDGIITPKNGKNGSVKTPDGVIINEISHKKKFAERVQILAT